MLGLRCASASQRVMSASMRARSDWIGFDIPGSDRWFARQPARDPCHRERIASSAFLAALRQAMETWLPIAIVRYFLLMGGPTSKRWRQMMQRAEAALRPQD